MHQSSTDQCGGRKGGRKGDMKRKPHSTKHAPLRGTRPKSYSDCSSVPFMRSSFNVIVHYWDHINSMSNKENMGSSLNRSSVFNVPS